MNRWNGTSRNGFSLIEVLIATTVLGLGTLGLIAVIAGSATQQQSASMQNLSVGVTQNADGLLSRMLGRTGLSLGVIPEGQWNAVDMDEESHFLTVAPGYMLVDFPIDSVVYDLNLSPGPIQQSQISDYLNFGIYSGGAQTFNDEPLDRLRHRRVHLEAGLTVSIEILEFDPSGGGMLQNPEIITFTAPPPSPPFTSDVITMLTNFPAGSLSTGSVLQFDRREAIEVGSAGIQNFSISGMTNRLINRITISPYQWRNDQLVSLSDRLVTEPEKSYPGGKRPIMGYSSLIRQTDTSIQLCFFTYTMRALSLPEDNETFRYRGLAFVPPDTAEDVVDEVAVLREVPLSLGYEANTQRYFFEIDQSLEEDFGWAIDQGQILMVSSRTGVVNSGLNPNDPGADFPVRVLTNRVVDEGRRVIRGYLDRSPRIDGRTPLMDLTVGSAREEVYAWAVQPLVKSRTDGTEWKLSVIDARVIQVASQ